VSRDLHAQRLSLCPSSDHFFEPSQDGDSVRKSRLGHLGSAEVYPRLLEQAQDLAGTGRLARQPSLFLVGHLAIMLEIETSSPIRLKRSIIMQIPPAKVGRWVSHQMAKDNLLG
jgi:hypothetical protein